VQRVRIRQGMLGALDRGRLRSAVPGQRGGQRLGGRVMRDRAIDAEGKPTPRLEHAVYLTQRRSIRAARTACTVAGTV
jgi:hypothetical protein